ncbi:MAG: hypothetical protein LBV47_07310 [Bacteroidales bacterium]|jgi:hypothetical protein|nr:hypothetical protein [Bacteroidales bacterium]
MKKRILCLAIAIISLFALCSCNGAVTSSSISSNISASNNAITFSNPNFEKQLRGMLSKENGEIITENDVNDIKQLRIVEQSAIEDLKYLTSLEELTCVFNDKLDNTSTLNSKTINLNNIGKLKEIQISGKLVTSLDLSDNPLLEVISVGVAEKLYKLTINNTPMLKAVNISTTAILNLDLSSKPAIEKIDINSPRISTLNLSNNAKLSEINIVSERLKKINISKAHALTNLESRTAPLRTALDLTDNHKLENLVLNKTGVSLLDLSNNSELLSLSVNNNKNIAKLNVSKLTKLKELYCSGNKLTELNINNNPELLYFSCENNKITELDVSKCPKLIFINCALNQLPTIDVSENAMLSTINISDNNIEVLDLQQNPAIKRCSYNTLKTAVSFHPSYQSNSEQSTVQSPSSTPSSSSTEIYTFERQSPLLLNNGEARRYPGLYFTETHDYSTDFEYLASTSSGFTYEEVVEYFSDLNSINYSVINILDTVGNNISEIAIDLWYCANSIYSVGGGGMFETDDPYAIGNTYFEEYGVPQSVLLNNYYDVVSTVFTENGIDQLEQAEYYMTSNSKPTPFIRKKDGKFYAIGGHKTGISYDWFLRNMEVKEYADNTITLSVTYKMVTVPGNVYEPITVDFKIAKVGSIWLVDDYIYPETK